MSHLSSVRQSLQVLSLVGKSRNSMGVSELSRALGVHRSNVYRVCQTLKAEGFLEQEPDSRKYRIGPVAYHVGQAYVGDGDLLKAAADTFGRLAPEYTWYCGILWGPEILLLVVLEGQGPVKVTARTGQRRWAHATALGKVLLAGLSDSELDRFLEVYSLPRVTANTITSRHELREVIREVRRRGWAESRSESLEGVSSFAAPVVNSDGTVVAGVSVSLLTHVVDNWGSGQRQDIINKVQAAASELSRFYPQLRRYAPAHPQVAGP